RRDRTRQLWGFAGQVWILRYPVAPPIATSARSTWRHRLRWLPSREDQRVKINMSHFNEHLGGLADDNPAVRRKAVSELAKYSVAEWQGSPEAVSAAVGTLGSLARHRTAASEATFRAEIAKTLGNIGTESRAVLPELLRLLDEDADASVRTEAARALGRIGEKAECATHALIAAIGDRDGGD